MLKQVVFYIDNDIKQEAQKYLKKEGSSLSAFTRTKLMELVKRKRKEENNGNF